MVYDLPAFPEKDSKNTHDIKALSSQGESHGCILLKSNPVCPFACSYTPQKVSMFTLRTRELYSIY